MRDREIPERPPSALRAEERATARARSPPLGSDARKESRGVAASAERRASAGPTDAGIGQQRIPASKLERRVRNCPPRAEDARDRRSRRARTPRARPHSSRRAVKTSPSARTGHPRGRARGETGSNADAQRVRALGTDFTGRRMLREGQRNRGRREGTRTARDRITPRSRHRAEDAPFCAGCELGGGCACGYARVVRRRDRGGGTGSLTTRHRRAPKKRLPAPPMSI